MKTPITSDLNLSDTTLLNTNHNSNFFTQSTAFSNSPASNQILRNSSNGTSNFTMDSLETRGVNALHRRAEQLKRWQEAEEEFEMKRDTNSRNLLINKAKNLIFKKRDDDRKIKFSNSKLFLAACASSDYDEINRLLDNNLVDINVGNIDGLTALHHACIDDNPELVEFLLKKGADVNCVDNEGWSPLHATASCDHIEIARLLLLYGADCTLVNVDHELALDLAEDAEMHKLLEDALYEQEKIRDFDRLRRQEEEKMREDVLEMIKTGIYDNKIHKRTGATILHVAACKGYLDILQMLFENKVLKKQIDINAKDNEGWTPLCAATYWNKPMIVELLLQNGADVNCVTNNNQTLEQMTDYDLILNLLAKRREQLKKKQETARVQEENKENGNLNNLNKSNAESETQRKAHAKRIRESRRSTQGISAEDVNKAKDQLLLNSSLNSTIINLSGNNNKQPLSSDKVEITKLDTISEIGASVSEELNQIQPSCIPAAQQQPSLQKTSSHSENSCEIVELKSELDSVDSQQQQQQRSKPRAFTLPYRPRMTVYEDDFIEQQVKARIHLDVDDIPNNDELKNDVVLNLRRDSLNILHQRKDTKKSAALNHSKTVDNSVRVERLDDYQPSTTNSIQSSSVHNLDNELNKELTNLEKTLDYTVRRDISQDSLDEQTNGNHNDYIGINSILNSSTAINYPSAIIDNHAGSNESSTITATKIQSIDDSRDKNYLNKNAQISRTHDSRQFDLQQIDKNVDRTTIELKEQQQQNQFNDHTFKQPLQPAQIPKFNNSNNEHRNLVINSNYLPPPIKSSTTATVNSNSQLPPLASSQLHAVKQFEVPVLIETPCTPEPPTIDEEGSTADSDTTSATLTNSSFGNDSENNLSKRKRPKRRIIENQEEIDVLFNETMNTINPKFTRNIDTSTNNESKNNFLYNKPNSMINNKPNQNGNALKLYKKIDEDIKLPNNTVNRSRPSPTTSATTDNKIKDYSNNQTDATAHSDYLVEKSTYLNDYKSAKTQLNNQQPLISQSTTQPTIVSQQTISNQPQRANANQLDYKKMYEDLLVEFENFKAEVNKKEQDYLRGVYFGYLNLSQNCTK